jgi:hypothetical protein
VRSNIITAMRKLCSHLRSLGLEDQLAQESSQLPEDGGGSAAAAAVSNSSSGQAGTIMTPKAAFDLLVAHLVDFTADPADLQTPNGDANNNKDWVGQSPRAGLGANNDAKQFLQLWRPIKTLWEVSVCVCVCVCVLAR